MKMNRKSNQYSYANSHNALMSRGYAAWMHKKIILLVEGKTDKAFIDRLGLSKLQCTYIGDPERASRVLKNIDKKNFVYKDAKASIKNIVENQFQQESKEVYYGLIDKDFGHARSYKNMLVTPQHDLETLLLFTDDTIFDNPERIEKSFEVTRSLAFRLGLIENYLWTNAYILVLENNRGMLDLSEIINVNERKIDLSNLVNFIREKRTNRELNLAKKENLKRDIKDYVVKADEDGMIGSDSTICYKGVKEIPDDIYDIANGHDIANIMKLLCREEMDEFVRSHNTEKHGYRAIEFAIIAKYNISNFKDTPLYDDMVNIGLNPTTI